MGEERSEERRGENRRGYERREEGRSGSKAGVTQRSSGYLLMCSVITGDMTGDECIVLRDSLNTVVLDENSVCCTTGNKMYSSMLQVGGGK